MNLRKRRKSIQRFGSFLENFCLISFKYAFQIQGFINGEDEQYDYVSGQLVAGDLITFSNQKKIYMVTNTVPVGSLSATTVNIFPPLLTALTTSPQTTVNVTNISAQVKSTNDVVEYSIGTENYYVFEQNFREVL